MNMHPSNSLKFGAEDDHNSDQPASDPPPISMKRETTNREHHELDLLSPKDAEMLRIQVQLFGYPVVKITDIGNDATAERGAKILDEWIALDSEKRPPGNVTRHLKIIDHGELSASEYPNFAGYSSGAIMAMHRRTDNASTDFIFTETPSGFEDAALVTALGGLHHAYFDQQLPLIRKQMERCFKMAETDKETGKIPVE